MSKQFKSDKVFEHMKKKYAERSDKDNIFGVGMTDTEFTNSIIYELLGEDWYVSDPLDHTQISEIAFHEIMAKYQPKRYKKYWKDMRYVKIYFVDDRPPKYVVCKQVTVKPETTEVIVHGGELDGFVFVGACGAEVIKW